LSKLRSSETTRVHSNIKKHQVVRDLKKFENHWTRVTNFSPFRDTLIPRNSKIGATEAYETR